LISQAHPGLYQAVQAAAIKYGDGSANVKKSLNAAVVGENVTRGRGVDERGAKATAEVRKKAAARGLNLRNGPAANRASELNHILNLINSAASASAASPTANTQRTESEGPQSNGPALNGAKEAKDTNRLSAKVDGQTPVGLGASLELKKQKSKQKA
jgi:protein TIF31